MTVKLTISSSGGSGGGQAEKNFLGDCPCPPPYMRVWMTAPPPISQSLHLVLSRTLF